MAAPWEKYGAAQPAAGPWSRYGGAVLSIPGTGPKAPSGYKADTNGGLTPIEGGPEALGTIAAQTGLRAGIEAGSQIGVARARAGIELATDNAKAARGQAPAGMRFRRDGTLEPIPGVNTPPPKTPDELRSGQQDLLNIIDQAQKAKGLAGTTTTGFIGEGMRYIPGTSAYDLSKLTDPVSANAALTRLQELRDSSKTGSAGGNVSDADMALFKASIASIDQGQSAEQFRGGLDTQIERARNMYKRLGGDMSVFAKDGAVAVDPYTGQRRDGTPPAAVVGQPPQPPAAPPSGGSSGGGGPIFGPSTPGGDPGMSLVSGGMRQEADPSLRGVNARVSNMVKGGASEKQLRDYLGSVGVDPSSVDMSKTLAWRAAHPGYRGDYDVQVDQRLVPMSTMRQMLNSGAQSPFGAGAIAAGQAASMNTLDNLTANPALTRAGMATLANEHGPATLIGSMIGAGATGAGLEAGLARLGAPVAANLAGMSLAPRAMAADALYGAGAGAGENDNGSRVGGALSGAGLGVVGGALGRKAVGMFGAGVAPTGGAAKTILDAGVRPTIGQRFAQSGSVGKTVNGLEQALQSIPLLGGSVRSAREGARDQFERGAFNQTLGELAPFGNLPTSLPKSVPLGNEAHAYMQKATNDAYSTARSQMQLIPDGQMSQDIGDFQRFLQSGAFNDQDVKSINELIVNNVGSRLSRAGGALSGDEYKSAVSDLGKAAGSMAASRPQAAGAVRDFTSILDGAARRSSPPEAGQLMDAADAAYAKQVRLEQASAARGGDTGRFSPTQFDAAVQKASGGVRSRAYLRGDALMGDYAAAGKGLVDTLPNSGTVDRALATGATGYGFWAHPYLTGGALAATAPTLPGIRGLVSGMMVPTKNGTRNAIGNYARKNQGMFGRGLGIAPLMLEYMPAQP